MKYIMISLISLSLCVTAITFNKPITEFCNTSFQQDTTKVFTVMDFINQKQFNGVIVLDNRKIEYGDSFLFDSSAKNKIKEMTILNKVPLDSIQKYGIEAKNGMFIMKTR